MKAGRDKPLSCLVLSCQIFFCLPAQLDTVLPARVPLSSFRMMEDGRTKADKEDGGEQLMERLHSPTLSRRLPALPHE